MQIGHARARRYANYRSGRKYESDGSGEVREQEPDAADNGKAEAGRTFHEKYALARDDPHYSGCRREWVRGEKDGEDHTS